MMQTIQRDRAVALWAVLLVLAGIGPRPIRRGYPMGLCCATLHILGRIDVGVEGEKRNDNEEEFV